MAFMGLLYAYMTMSDLVALPPNQAFWALFPADYGGSMDAIGDL